MMAEDVAAVISPPEGMTLRAADAPAVSLPRLLPRRKMREAHQELSQFVLRLELS